PASPPPAAAYRTRGRGRLADARPPRCGAHLLASALAAPAGPGGPAVLTRCRLAVLICSPPRSLRPPALAGRRYSLAVGSRCSSARLRARCAHGPRCRRPSPPAGSYAEVATLNEIEVNVAGNCPVTLYR